MIHLGVEIFTPATAPQVCRGQGGGCSVSWVTNYHAPAFLGTLVAVDELGRTYLRSVQSLHFLELCTGRTFR